MRLNFCWKILEKISFYKLTKNYLKGVRLLFIFDMKKIRLVLEDGSVFYGHSFGAEKSVSGEVVFSTGMTGYPETMTDPSFHGQILVMTYPLIGNYGIPSDEKQDGLPRFFESENIYTKGIVISDYSFEHSHWNAKRSLDDWMKSQDVPGIYGIDTRELTKKLREKGTMLGKIIVEKDIDLFDPGQVNLVAEVSVKEPITYSPKKPVCTILLLDCGVKASIIRSFLKRDVRVIRAPWDYDPEKIEHDALFISNGPGDPAICKEAISNIRRAINKDKPKPVMGICLGNQLLALAAGAKTYKLRYGHRSQNQPCIHLETKRCYITSQNHGYAVDDKTLPPEWKPLFINANDNTNEGIFHCDKPFFSVQFHPEANPGPVDTEFLFDKFIEVIKGG